MLTRSPKNAPTFLSKTSATSFPPIKTRKLESYSQRVNNVNISVSSPKRGFIVDQLKLVKNTLNKLIKNYKQSKNSDFQAIFSSSGILFVLLALRASFVRDEVQPPIHLSVTLWA